MHIKPYLVERLVSINEDIIYSLSFKYCNKTYSNNDAFRCMCNNRICLIRNMSTKRYNQIKVSLIRIWLSLFPHVVRSGFTKMQSSNSCF